MKRLTLALAAWLVFACSAFAAEPSYTYFEQIGATGVYKLKAANPATGEGGQVVDGNAIVLGTVAAGTYAFADETAGFHVSNTSATDWYDVFDVTPAAVGDGTDYKAYLCFRSSAGADKIRMGRNRTGEFIIFLNEDSRHIFTGREAADGGGVFINASAGTPDNVGLRLNSEAGSSTKGIEYYSGGASPALVWTLGSTMTMASGPLTIAKAAAPTSITTANGYLNLGSSEYGSGSYRMIGLGYIGSSATNPPAWMGYAESTSTGYTNGRIIFGTRNVTTNTAATERMSIETDGMVKIGGTGIGPADHTPGTGISTGTGTICEHSALHVGGLFKTEIVIDLTGLNSSAAGDIIGVNGGTANCHLGQITAAKNGTAVAARITCTETPAGGNTDVDFWYADEATGAEDAAVTGLTNEIQMIDHGAWTAGETAILTALPAADKYLYAVAGGETDATYTAGIFVVEMWGK